MILANKMKGKSMVTRGVGIHPGPDCPGSSMIIKDSLGGYTNIGKLCTSKNSDVCYVGPGSGYLSNIDISDPNSLVNLVTIYNGYAPIGSISVSDDDVLYAAHGNGTGLKSYDVSDPLQILLLDTITGGITDAISSVLVDNFLYIAGNLSDLTAATLTIVDVSNPNNLVKKDQYFQGGTFATSDIDVIDNVAYLSSTGNGIISLDVSDASNIVYLGLLPTPAGFVIHNLSVYNSNYLFYGDYNGNALVSVDISDPINMVEVSSFTHADLIRPRSLTISGTVAYLGGQTSDRIVSVDISDPANMIFIDSTPVSAAKLDLSRNMAMHSDGTLYVAAYSNDALTAVSACGNP